MRCLRRAPIADSAIRPLNVHRSRAPPPERELVPATVPVVGLGVDVDGGVDGAATTLKLTSIWALEPADDPVMVSGYVPGAVAADTDNCSVFPEKVAVTPLGRPATL